MDINCSDVKADIYKQMSRSSKPLIAARVRRCAGNACNRCGDLCPSRALRWLEINKAALARCFPGGKERSRVEVRYVGFSPAYAPRQLVDVKLPTIMKGIRRSLERLSNPNAVGLFFIGVARVKKQWRIVVRGVVSGVDERDMQGIFANGLLKVTEIRNLIRSLERITLLHYSLVDNEDAWTTKATYRSEFYRCIGKLNAGARRFMYGIDKHLNPMPKENKKPVLKVRKTRPYPHWLQSKMFGNHPSCCRCKACQR